MAQSVMQYLVNRQGISAAFQIDSAATSREEIGNPLHPGTVEKLQKESILVIPHRAVQMKTSDYEEYDYLIGMDSANLRNMRCIVGDDPEKKMFLLLEFAGEKGDIADPWYTGNFEDTYRDVRRGCEGLWFILDCPRNCPHPPPADELGYISFDREAADLLFTVLSLRASRKSTIITSNLTF